jgi:hypothetical protein
VVDSGYRGDVQPFGESDDGCVHSAQREVGILLDEFGSPSEVVGGGFHDCEKSTGERA